MCRNIKLLFNFDPPTTNEEINAAALQFVRKVSGFQSPSKVNVQIFQQGINQVTEATRQLLNSLVPQAKSHNRETEAAKTRARTMRRLGT